MLRFVAWLVLANAFVGGVFAALVFLTDVVPAWMAALVALYGGLYAVLLCERGFARLRQWWQDRAIARDPFLPEL